MTIRFRPEAQAEFDAAVDWYERQAGLGADFIARVRESLERIAANPELYAPIYRDVRKAPVKKYPYIVIYRAEDAGILVLSIFHSARDPATWRSRA